MRLTLDFVIFLILLFIIADFLLFLRIIINKLQAALEERERKEALSFMVKRFINRRLISRKKKRLFKSRIKDAPYSEQAFVESYFAFKESFLLGEKEDEDIRTFLEDKRIISKYQKELFSGKDYKRAGAAVFLRYFQAEQAIEGLEKALKRERDLWVKLFIAYSLCSLRNTSSIAPLVESLVGEPLWYRKRVHVFLAEYGVNLFRFLKGIKEREEREIKELFFYFSTVYINDELKEYLLTQIEKLLDSTAPEREKKRKEALLHEALFLLGERLSRREKRKLCAKKKGFLSSLDIEKKKKENRELLILAVQSLGVHYYHELYKPDYLENEDWEIRKLAIKALGREAKTENITLLLTHAQESEAQAEKQEIVFSLRRILYAYPRYKNLLLENYHRYEEKTREVVALALAENIDYFSLKLLENQNSNVRELLKKIILLQKTSALIEFLNGNKNKELEDKILEIISEAGDENPQAMNDLRLYLKESLKDKLNLARQEEEQKNKKEGGQQGKLYLLLIFNLLLFPAIYVLRYWDILPFKSFGEHLRLYIIDFNLYIIFYALIFNLIYSLLLMISFKGAFKQLRFWNLKKKTFLFTKNVLPSITIIAPAFNEENTIVESINSLLNLNYPEYEVVVVNDGSNDRTLEKLISNFGLEKADIVYEERLASRRIRGLYRNKKIAKLLVVDKENGGKADALNAGINFSRNEYFCGIDSDSLLEGEALLKIASRVVDGEGEDIAMGGNILPINGCLVQNGNIKEYHVPGKTIGKFQMMEYIRAFMGGRIGWAEMNNLLIVSGAFGLFKKSRVLEIGGYLTESGKYNKDTVGEDMELVVRMLRHMRERKLPYRISYSFIANCWTEVPENMKTLYRQRDRWQRGLIDIIVFHRKMLFNPRYGRIGLIAMPYYFLFEMIGPLIEVQGYSLVIVAGIMGLLNLKIGLLLFLVAILQGMVISMASLLIAQKEFTKLSVKETLNLVFFSILENLGFRQLMSILRFFGYLNALKRNVKWGKMERKGFESQGLAGEVQKA